MAIFLVYSTSGITSGKKLCRELKMAAILKILKYWTQLQFDLRYEKIVPNYAEKSIFMMMTSSMTSQGGLKVGPLYSYMNEIVTFIMITKQRAKISSLNFLCICIIRLWLQLYEYIFMTSLMTSPGHKIGQILKLIYLRHYCPACRTTLVATRFRVAVICPIIQVPHCIRVFFYFVWLVFINHIFQFYYELCTYCNILDIYLS